MPAMPAMPALPALCRTAAALAALVLVAPAAGAQTAPRHHGPARPQPAHPAAPPAAQATPPLQTPMPTPVPPASPPAVAAAADRCQALLAELPLSQFSPPGSTVLDDGGCRFTGLRVGSSRFGYQAETVTEHGVTPGLAQDPTTVPDRKLDVQVHAQGITFSLHIGNARTDWLNRRQQIPFDASLDAAYDPAGGSLTLRNLSLDGVGIGHASLALEATGLDSDVNPATTRLRSLHVRLDSRQVLAMFTLPLIAGILPDGDPDAALKTMEAQVTAGLRALLPLAHATPQTVDALAAAVADFPHPEHVLDVTVTTADPVLLADLYAALEDPARAPAVLGRLTVTATYTGDPP